MIRSLSRSVLLLVLLVIVTCGIYPFLLWCVGSIFFPFQANGSLLLGADDKPIGSRLIAQPFTKDNYFQPRPSAASYDASASASSALAASNYVLRERVARMLGSIVQYKNGGLAAADIEKWFQQDKYQADAHIVAQWAVLHPALAAAWVAQDATHSSYVDNWNKAHAVLAAQTDNAAVLFFQAFAKENPGKFPALVTKTDAKGKSITSIQAVNSGSDIQSIFFDMWRTEHPDIELQSIPADMVTTSASGLDPDITLQNAKYQLDRVVHAWAVKLNKQSDIIKDEINTIVMNHSSAPLAGLAGEPMVNVLEVNLELRNKYGAP